MELIPRIATKKDLRRSGKEIIQQLIQNVENQLKLHPLRIFILAVVAGGLLSYGAALGVRLSVGLENEGTQRFMLAVGFLSGLSTVALSGSLMNSVVNVEYSIYLLNSVTVPQNRSALKKLGLLWILINLGNFIGALGTSALIVYTDVFSPSDELRLGEILFNKLKNVNNGFSGFCIVFVSGMMANWIVGHAIMNAASSRSTPGKVIGIFFCVIIFAALGLQHGIANMGQIFLGLFSNLQSVSWTRCMLGNIIPANLGNALGGFLFVAFPFWYSFYFDKLPRNDNTEIRKTDQTITTEPSPIHEMLIDMDRVMETHPADSARIVITGLSVRQRDMSTVDPSLDLEARYRVEGENENH